MNLEIPQSKLRLVIQFCNIMIQRVYIKKTYNAFFKENYSHLIKILSKIFEKF